MRTILALRISLCVLVLDLRTRQTLIIPKLEANLAHALALARGRTGNSCLVGRAVDTRRGSVNTLVCALGTRRARPFLWPGVPCNALIQADGHVCKGQEQRAEQRSVQRARHDQSV